MPWQIPILAYHSILKNEHDPLPPGWSPPDTVPYPRFLDQLDQLKMDGWRGISPAGLNEQAIRNSRQKCALITFDDGHASDLLAAQALAARGFTATFFVPWSSIGREHFLDLNGVNELSRSGFTIGSHGLSHCRLTDLDPDAIRRELSESKSRLEDLLGRTVADLAVPFGRYDRRVIKAALEVGYSRVMTSDVSRATIGPGRKVFPRVPVKSSTNSADFSMLIEGSAFMVMRQRVSVAVRRRIQTHFGGYQGPSITPRKAITAGKPIGS
ncbi:MAG: polysaccharide deacetylase family protein [Candidatus Binataceae bacterium]